MLDCDGCSGRCCCRFLLACDQIASLQKQIEPYFSSPSELSGLSIRVIMSFNLSPFTNFINDQDLNYGSYLFALSLFVTFAASTANVLKANELDLYGPWKIWHPIGIKKWRTCWLSQSSTISLSLPRVKPR